MFPLTTMDYFGLPWMTILMSLATAAGIGGGEIIVPMLAIFFKFNSEDAAPIAQWCIMIAGITRFIINYGAKHPYRDAVAIDYNAAMILMPAVFLGSSLGVMLHYYLPEVVQNSMLMYVNNSLIWFL